MKLLHFYLGDAGHHKNIDSMKQMCSKLNIEYSVVRSIDAINSSDAELVWIHDKYFDPDLIPNKKILVGPQLFVFPSGDICGEEIDRYKGKCCYTSLSPWVKQFVLSFSPFKIPIEPLPFGVDMERFKPVSPIKERDSYFIYFKMRHSSILNDVLEKCKEINLKQHIFHYGSYQEENYREILKRSRFGIWVGLSESQGFALQEALASDVPLIVLNVKTIKEGFINNTFVFTEISLPLYATTVSYWSEKCGEIIYNPDELISSYKKLESSLEFYKPREFIEENLSHEVCMKRILNYFNLT